ncbi:MAG: 5-dehydro-4-deoxy-D-glucuronate isomerase [Chloroflexota bacterium]
MEMRYPVHQKQVERMNTEELRDEFLIENLFEAGKLSLVYSHIDRVIVGGAVPAEGAIKLEASKHDLAADYFLERREIGIINIGGDGRILVDGESYSLAKQDGLYVGKGVQEVLFSSDDAANPAQFYLFSSPAHAVHPTAHLKLADAEPLHLGDPLNSNKRTIYKYIHPDGAKSCQIVMGMTLLEPGSMWNTMPAHLHARRMEVYLYFDIDADNVVFHLMGEVDETRHLVMRDREAGENQSFADMDMVAMDELR